MKQIRNPIMVLVKASDYEKLTEAGDQNMVPIIKLFVENLTWLVTGITPDGRLWGYADLGFGDVEWGSLCFEDELPTMKGRIAYLERDRYFKHKDGAKYLEMESLVGI